MTAAPPFTERPPRAEAVPVVYDTPHSGRFYPPDFASGQAQTILRRAEDAYVDELIGAAPDAGIAMIEANYPRAYIDLNRDAEDIDPDMLDAPWPGDIKPSKKSEMGLGLIRRFVTPGVAIYDRKLSVDEVRRRLDAIYRPYHRVLAEMLARTKSAFGFVWHVDWHSMKSVGNAMTPDGAGAQRPDFVVGDLDGGSAARTFTEAAIELLRRRNYKVTLNDPYKGASIVRRYGRPAEGVHTIQIEINRRLYLNEA
ncbi:MAG: N-formylglutamate amidohydrolase, partial [Proteobacteria bacterium]|nr:N-formylglutamate amidohydrolase [Pseudomonadota bacterium]